MPVCTKMLPPLAAVLFCLPVLARADDAQPSSDDQLETATATSPSPENDGGWDPEPASPSVAAPAPVATAPPPPGPTPEELEDRRRLQRARGMMIGGWATLGVTYGAALTVGVVAIDTAKGDDERRRMWGRRMTIPIGGPVAAAFVSKTATGTLFTVLTGAAQLTGLTLGIVGTTMFAKEHGRQQRLAFSVLPDPDGGVQMGASWRF